MAAHSEDFIDPDDIGVNASTEPSIGDLIERRLSRRDALRGLAGVSVAASLGSPFASTDAQAQVNGPSTLTFKELAHTLDDTQHVAEGYEMQVLIRWGDPGRRRRRGFRSGRLTAAEQEKQFGYNNDYLGLYPLPAGSRSGDRFLMVVNHEYTNTNLMFAGLGAGSRRRARAPPRSRCAVEMASRRRFDRRDRARGRRAGRSCPTAGSRAASPARRRWRSRGRPRATTR